jgi:hypothetical protein
MVLLGTIENGCCNGWNKKGECRGETELMTVVHFGRQARFRNAACVNFGAAIYNVQIGEAL